MTDKHPQKATLWREAGSAWDGSVSWQRVGVFDTRWEDESRLVQSNNQRMIQARSTIYSAEDIFEIGDMVAEGEFIETSPVTTAFEVKDKIRTPNLSGTRYEYRVIV